MTDLKIRKNLSDADMFRGMEEEETFETAYSHDGGSSRRKSNVKTSTGKIALPDDVIEKLNRCILEADMKWLQDKNGDMEWKVRRDGYSIVLKPAKTGRKGR